MTNILLYSPPIYKCSGGLGNFKLFFDICKQLKYKIYFCPLLKNIDSLNFISEFNDKSINSITHKELVAYYNVQDCDTILEEDIVTPQILQSRNNVIIYAEDIIGNPAEQKYVVRWLFFFPIPPAVASYNFNKDLIYFFSDCFYNLYKYVCDACGIKDQLTSNIKQLNICRIIKFEPEIYKSIKRKTILNKNMRTNAKCFTIRKLFPPYTFRNYNNCYNILYATEIYNKYTKQIQYTTIRMKNTDNIFTKNEIKTELISLKKNPPNVKSYDVIREYLKDKFTNNGYDNIEQKPFSKEYIDYFLNKDFFISFDPFTFITIISSLCGCVSVIKKINNISYDVWMNCDPFIKYGIAYGSEGIEHALKTQHLLLDHITNMYSENENNVINFMKNIEKHYNISLK